MSSTNLTGCAGEQATINVHTAAGAALATSVPHAISTAESIAGTFEVEFAVPYAATVGGGDRFGVLIQTTVPTDQVTNVSGSPLDRSVQLTWTAPNNGGLPVSYYQIEVAPEDGSTGLPGTYTTAVAQTSPHETGITTAYVGWFNNNSQMMINGNKYWFRISAANAHGLSPASAGTSAAPTIPFGNPSPPTNVAATTGSATSTVTWTASSSGNGRDLVGYRVTRSLVDGNGEPGVPTELTANTGSLGTTYNDSGLDPAEYYIYYIQAINSGSLLSSSSRNVSIMGSPQNFVVSARGDSVVTVRWQVPVTYGADTITSYKVEYAVDNGSNAPSSTWNAAPGGNVSPDWPYMYKSVTGLTNATKYWFRVSAINPIATGYAAQTGPAVPYTIPGAPASASATTGGFRQVNLSWTAPAFNGGDTITSYQYEYAADEGGGQMGGFSGLTTVGAGTSTTVGSLTQGSSYYFRVRAVNNAGAGDWTYTSSPATAG